MTTRSWLTILVLASLPLACSRGRVGCARDLGPGGVRVVLALPRGPVDWVSSVDVSFDRSMVELGAATSRHKDSPLSLEPKTAGRFNWIGTRTASFVPEKPLPRATRFRVTVPAGLRSVDGKSVGEEMSWEFTTPLPAVVRSFPEPGEMPPETGRPPGRAERLRVPRRVRTTPVPPDLSIVLEFNQPVEPAAVERVARLAPEGHEGAAVSLHVSRSGKKEEEIVKRWPGAPETHRVVVKPDRPLARDTAWELSLGPWLKGSEGPLPMGRVHRLLFRTYGPFRVTAVRSTDAGGRTVFLTLTNPVDADSLIPFLRFNPPVELRGAWQGGDPADTGVYGDFKAGTDYELTVLPGLKDLFGNAVEPPPAPLRFRTGDLPPSVRITPRDAVLELGSRREIAILLSNVGAARLELKSLGAADVTDFLREDMGGEEMGGAAGRWSWPMAGGISRTLTRRTARNVIDTVFVRTDEVLGVGRGGVVAVQVTSLDPLPRTQPGPPVPPRDKTLIRVTDLGVTSKVSETEGVAWVTSLQSGEPVPGVALEIRDNAGRLSWSGRSGPDGLASTAGIRLREEWPPRHYRLFARLGGDFTYLTLGKDWALEGWNFGIPVERWDPERDLDGLIYGDRELYRPGEVARLKAMLRRRTLGGLEPPPPGTVVRLEISDSRGQPVLSETRALTRFGTLYRDVSLPKSARPGTWSVTITSDEPPERRRWAVWGSLRVEEYRAPEFEVEVDTKRPWYQSGQALEGEIRASYLFGAPLAGGTVQWSLSRHPASFAPPGYDDYRFSDPEITPEYEVLAGRGEGRLDGAGRLEIHPPLDLGGLPVSMNYTLEAEVRDLTGQASAAETNVTVHRGLAYPGIRVAETLVREGTPIAIDVILLSPEGKPAQNASGKVSLVKREWKTARRLLVGGVIGSETTPVDSVLETRPLPAGPGPHRLTFRVPSPGYYRVLAEATDGARNRLRCAGDFYAWGKGEYAWGWEPGVRLELVTDRKSYAPGDTARVLVRSPFRSALALISVEREGLRDVRTRRLEGTSETIAIPIPLEGAAPNLYVSVAVVTGSAARDGADPRLRLPEFRLGYATLDIDHRSRILAVTATPSKKEALPGDSIQVAITLRDQAGRPVSGEVSLAVVDEAVLRLLGTTTPDPAGHFYRPRGISVLTSELRRLVRRAASEEQKGGEPGGGGGGEAFRSLFATTAYWNPAIVTDASGRAVAGFRLPDNLTTFRIMAVALDQGDRFGSGEERFVVTKPLLVQPALPRFASAGDRFRAGAVIHNRTDRPLEVDVTSAVEGIVARDRGTSRVPVPAGGSTRTDFAVLATAPGKARVRFTARSGAFQDGVEISLPVILPADPRREATAGRITDSHVTEGVAVPAAALPDSSRLLVSVAPTLIGQVRNAFHYVETYRYLCLEQVGSAEWARLLEARLFRTEPREKAAARAVERLTPFQKEDGGFALWPRYDSSSAPYTTAWALLVLAEARRAGADVTALSEPAVRYLGWMFDAAEGDTAQRISRASEWALALWALSELEPDEFGAGARRSRLEFLTASRERLNATARLYLALAWEGVPGGEAAQRALLSELDNRTEQVADQAFLTERTLISGFDAYWYSPVRLNGLYLTASIRSGRGSPLDPGIVRWLLEQRREARWPSTQDNIMALLGLVAWREAYESTPPAVSVTASLGKGREASWRFTSLEQPPGSVAWPAGRPGASATLDFNRQGSGALYYTAALEYLEPTIGGRPVETSLTLVRSYEVFDPEGSASSARAATRLTAGDLVLVRLTLVVPEESDFLAIADPLPAGFEPVNLGFVTTAREAARRYLETGVYRPGREGLPVEYEEQRDREVRAFTGSLQPGVYEYRYLARAVTPGRFAAPRARAELMYHPEVVSLTDGPWIEIEPK